MSSLSHRSLRRVLQSLITATLSSQPSRIGHGPKSIAPKSTDPWTDDFLLHEGTQNALGCDSLDLLHISSAVNEMFHLHEAGFETRLLHASSFGDWLAIVEAAWRSGVGNITVSTSGSTGKPKLCTHTFASLGVEATFLAEFFSTRRRIVMYTPAHHIYGILFAGLLPDRLGIAVVDLQSAGTQPLAQATGGGVLCPGDLVVSFPDGWSWIDRNIRTVPDDVEGVTSTAPCPRRLLDSMMESRLSRMVEVYGSSETAGIGTRIWPEPRYRLMPHLQRIFSPDGLDHLETRFGHQLPSMDHLEFFAEDTFLVNGRKDGCVQVGGVNVCLPSIERRLREHPDVAEVSVQLMRPEEGQRLKCHLVPRSGCDIHRLKQSLLEQIASWPKAAERPVVIHCDTSLAQDASDSSLSVQR